MYQRVGDTAFKKDLTNIIALCQWLENPQNTFKSIHIAGTNGKGSVAHMLASVLVESGLKVGIYTSPHYIDFRERIKINSEYVSEDFVISFTEKFKNSDLAVQPSFFELSVAMAFEYFKQQDVDIAIIETGLGGRLDSTNIIQPEFSIITNISLDHQQYLGSDLESIAREKAGIIKIKTPVIVGEENEELRGVFSKIAEEKDAEISFTADLFHAEIVYSDIYKSVANIFSFGNLVLENVELPLSAKYQWKNVLLTFHALHLWNDSQAHNVGEKDFKDGLSKLTTNTSYIARSKFLKSKIKNCLVGWDSAHNEAGIKAFIEEVQAIDYDKLHIILSAVKDKDLEHVLKQLPSSAKYYFCEAHIPRAMDSQKLMETAADFGLIGECFKTSEKAFDHTLQHAHENDLIIICGSIFTIGELMSAGRIG